MDHVVYVDAKAYEMEKLLNGEKKMIIRGAAGRKVPYGRVDAGDVLYFINNNAEGQVKAKAVVSDVFNSNKIERNVNTTSTRTHNMIQWNERMFIFNLTYRFSQNDKNINFEVDKDKTIMF